jgi:hypothetical protein
MINIKTIRQFRICKSYQLSKQLMTLVKRKAALNMAVVEENRKSFPLALTYRKAETWKDSLNNQNKVWAMPNWKEVCSYAETKEVNVLEAENK